MRLLVLLGVIMASTALVQRGECDPVPQARAQHASGADSESNEHAQKAMDAFKKRIQISEEVAAALSPAEKLTLLSGIICDAEDQLEDMRRQIRKERRTAGHAGGTSAEMLKAQDIVVREQQARIAHARQMLGRATPMACARPEMEDTVACLRAQAPIGRPADPNCRVPDFWKYQRALLNLDAQWRNLFFRGSATPTERDK